MLRRLLGATVAGAILTGVASGQEFIFRQYLVTDGPVIPAPDPDPDTKPDIPVLPMDPDLLPDIETDPLVEDDPDEPRPAGGMILTYSATNSVSLALTGASATVWWGDGTHQEVTGDGIVTHTYSSPGARTVTITGSASGFSASVRNSETALTAVEDFGTLGLTSLANAFRNADNLASVAPVPASVLDLTGAFGGVDRPSGMAGLPGWNVSRVTDMTDMLAGSGTFNSDLSGWCVSHLKRPNGFSTPNLLVAEPYWKVPCDGYQDRVPMELVFSGTSASFRLDGFDAIISWGDGTKEYVSDRGTSILSHTWATAGEKRVTIRGVAHRIDTPSSNLVEIASFGNLGISDFSDSFTGVTNLRRVAPLPAAVADIHGMFAGTAGAMDGIGSWDVSRISDFSGLFMNGTTNADFSGWNLRSATDMADMFLNNQGSFTGLGTWDVSHVTSFSSMFMYDANFRGDLSRWNVAAGADFSGMFDGATSFASDLSRWNVSAGTNFGGMFGEADAFNADISAWNVSAATDMTGMFAGADRFDGDLAGWCVTKIATRPQDFATPGKLVAEPRWGSCGPPSSADMLITYTGTAASFSFGGPPNVVIDWGDGSAPQTVTTTATVSHTYASNKAWQVRISGTATSFSNKNVTTLTSVESFGNLGLRSLAGAFDNADKLASLPPLPPTVTNLDTTFQNSGGTLAGIESWKTGAVTSMSGTFRNSSVNRNLSKWDTSAVTTMAGMFEGNKSFNQSIGGWDVDQVTSFTGMFQDADAFKADLSTWMPTAALDMTNLFHLNDGFTGNLSSWCLPKIPTRPKNFAANGKLAAEPLWGVCAGSPFTSGMSLVYAQSGAGFRLGKADVLIDWGDGSAVQAVVAPTATTTLTTHSYSTTGPWRVRIAGKAEIFQNYNTNLTAVESFGDLGIRTLASAFVDADRLATVAPLPATVTDLSYAFQNSSGALDGVQAWAIDQVTTLKGTFSGSTFNRDISRWNTANVTDMAALFDGDAAFNQAIGGWDTARVRSFATMFREADAFTADISGWQVPDVRDMTSMFHGNDGFSGDLSSWCLRYVASRPVNFATPGKLAGEPAWGTCPGGPFADAMVLAYSGASGTAISIGLAQSDAIIDWGDGSVPQAAVIASTTPTYFSHTYTTSGPWKVRIGGTAKSFRNSTATASALALTSIESFGNLGLTSLDTAFYNTDNLASVAPLPASVTNLHDTFAASGGALTGLEAWDTSHVTNMAGTFRDSTFNRDISGWNTAEVTTMEELFYLNRSFNQPIGSWNVEKVVNFADTFAEADAFTANIEAWRPVSATNMWEMFYKNDVFDNDLTRWCVAKIPEEPGYFAYSAKLTRFPRWGYCPTVDSDMRLTFEGTTASLYFYSKINGLDGTGTHVVVDWGDGTKSMGDKPTYSGVTLSHTYADGGTHKVTVWGRAGRFSVESPATLRSVDSFGTLGIVSLYEAFANADNLEYVAPLPSTVTELDRAFMDSDARIRGLGDWDTGNVQSMSEMFQNARVPSIYGDLNTWDTGNVTDMSEMFTYAYDLEFLHPIWNVRKVKNFFGMFSHTTLPPLMGLLAWEPVSATNMDFMFYGAAYIQPQENLSLWCVPSLTKAPMYFGRAAPSPGAFCTTDTTP
ncbi:DUF285 domain-containing protein [Cereibacter sphaeroides]|uniref:DUF285 domain-containing protein n=3 Tax=Cereibacter sphaeroides TaxID=1063 RepID=UPI001F372D6F|nr:DUF285 domain-containing protein [Cereibacter sphaeroides]MCE6959378.1 DUF285 domain-containing protein [Cereibacter sphaeroides]